MDVLAACLRGKVPVSRRSDGANPVESPIDVLCKTERLRVALPCALSRSTGLWGTEGIAH